MPETWYEQTHSRVIFGSYVCIFAMCNSVCVLSPGKLIHSAQFRNENTKYDLEYTKISHLCYEYFYLKKEKTNRVCYQPTLLKG